MNTFLYLLTVLIWGTTWIAITFQLGVVPAPVSIAYRFWIAAAVLLAGLLITRRKWWPPRQAAGARVTGKPSDGRPRSRQSAAASVTACRMDQAASMRAGIG